MPFTVIISFIFFFFLSLFLFVNELHFYNLNCNLTAKQFYATRNPEHCSSDYSSYYKIGNIAVLNIYFNITDISGYDGLLLCTLPFNIVNTVIISLSINNNVHGILYINKDGTIKFHANGETISSAVVLTQVIVIKAS